MLLSTLTISGMRSVHCTRAVYTALGGVKGVVTATVALGSAEVEHDRRTYGGSAARCRRAGRL